MTTLRFDIDTIFAWNLPLEQFTQTGIIIQFHKNPVYWSTSLPKLCISSCRPKPHWMAKIKRQKLVNPFILQIVEEKKNPNKKKKTPSALDDNYVFIWAIQKLATTLTLNPGVKSYGFHSHNTQFLTPHNFIILLKHSIVPIYIVAI